jgi:fructose/tagatose bisphosphate aldolase
VKNDNRTAKQILTDARRARLGVAAFNFTDIWDPTAILNAAQRGNVPMTASSYWGVAEAVGLDVCQAMALALQRNNAHDA